MKAGKKFACCGVIFLALPILLGLSIIFPGLHDFSIELPHGYQLISPSSENNNISDPKSWELIGANVDGYRVVKDVVVGHVSPRLVLRGDTRPQEATGYFILDTKTGKIQKGLTRSDWASRLRAHGIAPPPKFKRPNKILAWLSKIGVR